jgi:hypothetical protein
MWTLKHGFCLGDALLPPLLLDQFYIVAAGSRAQVIPSGRYQLSTGVLTVRIPLDLLSHIALRLLICF